MMEEIELIRELDSPYVVGYIDSFIDTDLSINIILEFCPGGDLQTYMAKQAAATISAKKMGPGTNLFHDNFIWRISLFAQR
jgi:serine/threonine protein kinase